MKKNRVHIFLLIAFVSVFIACNKKSNLPPLKETFYKADKNPFGSYVAYNELKNIYPENAIIDKKKSFDKTWNNISDTAALYVCISPNLYVNSEEIRAMLGYVYAGNTLFISANYIDEELLNEINCTENYYPIYTFEGFYDSMRNTKIISPNSPFNYYYHPFKNSFTYNDSTFTKVLGVNEANEPNYILYFHGKGKLFLHCDPKSFSNYFLLQQNNYQYMQNVFGYANTTPENLYWDDYYRQLSYRKRSNNSNFSSLSEIMKNPPLAAAFWLCLASLLLYILFGAKRRQRIIAKLKPNENNTVAFAETIGRLYLQKKDNKNIAEKMSTYFNEHIRNNYFLSTINLNDDFITSLSRKSGVPKDKVETLYRTMQQAQQSETVDDYQLLSLNQQIQNFYKK